jgi:hypothetical protein
MNAMELSGAFSKGEGMSRRRRLIYRGSMGKEEWARELEGRRGKGKRRREGGSRRGQGRKGGGRR